jgi:DNA-binding NtrC family response regulator
MQAASASPMICVSAAMQVAKLNLQKAATSDCTVLITGETGTGKEVAAEFLHANSARHAKAFVCINCAAIPDGLLESELFGHAKGAYTGANEFTDGLLVSANGGTVFLDEIGDMSLLAQAKILRVIDRKEVCRVGGNQVIRLNVRFVAASNQELEEMVSRGTFRKDLFFRLNVARIHLPPLRDRKDDIPALLQHYCNTFSGKPRCEAPEISEKCLKLLLQYGWPGNIRELKNTVEWMLQGEPAGQIDTEHLPQNLRRVIETTPKLSPSERDLLLSVLFSTKWNKSEAARSLHWSRMTLYRKIAKYQIKQGPDNPSLPR